MKLSRSELGLAAVVRRHRGDERTRRVLGGDRIGGDGVATGLGQRLLDRIGIGRVQIDTGDVAVGGERLVDIRAEMPVDDAGRRALAVEQHLQRGDLRPPGEGHCRSGGIAEGTRGDLGRILQVPPSSGWRSIGSRVTIRGCGASG